LPAIINPGHGIYNHLSKSSGGVSRKELIVNNSPVKVLRLSIQEGAEYSDGGVVDNSPVKVLRLSIQEGAEYGDGSK
jgi:hypothetical protein